MYYFKSVNRVLCGILVVTGLVAAGPPQGPARVPCDIQFDLTVKILAFDRKLSERFGEEVVIGILFQSSFPASLQVKTEMERAMMIAPIKKVGTIPIRTLSLDLDQTARWDQGLKSAGIDVVYLAPLREQAKALDRILLVCRQMRLTTVGSLPEYPGRGAAIGFEPLGDKPVIVINLTAARAEGADFNSRLLGMARVIR